MDTPVLEQTDLRFRDDDGSETAATWRQDINVADTQDVDTVYRIRIVIKETAGFAAANVSMGLEYSLNGGAFTDASEVSSVIDAGPAAGSQLVDEADTTQQLTSPDTFVTPNGGQEETNGNVGGGANDFAGNDSGEYEIAYLIIGADVSPGDTIDLRLARATGLTYTRAFLRITVAGAGQDELGEADLDVVGTTSIKAAVDHVPKAALTVSATVVAKPTPDVFAKSALTVSAVLAAEGTVEVLELGEAALTVSAVVALKPFVEHVPKAALSVTAITSHLSEVEHSAKAALAVSAVLTGQPTPEGLLKSALTGSATLAADGTLEGAIKGEAALTVSAVLAGAPEVDHPAKAALSGSLVLVAKSTPEGLFQAALTASASLTGQGRVDHEAKTALAVSGALTGAPEVEHSGKAALTVSASLVALALPDVFAKATLSVSAVLAAKATSEGLLKSALTASAVLAGEGTVTGMGEEELGVAALLVSATTLIEARLAPRGSTNWIVSAVVGARGNVALPAAMVLAASAVLKAKPTIDSDNITWTQYGPLRLFFRENLGPDEEVAVSFVARLKRTGTHAAVIRLREVTSDVELARLDNGSTSYESRESPLLDLRRLQNFTAEIGRKAAGQAVEVDFAAIRVRSRGIENYEAVAPLTFSAIVAAAGQGGSHFAGVFLVGTVFSTTKAAVDHVPKFSKTGAATLAAEGTVTP